MVHLIIGLPLSQLQDVPSWIFAIEFVTCPLPMSISGPSTLQSRGWHLWVVWGGRRKIITVLCKLNATKWELWPSSRRRRGRCDTAFSRSSPSAKSRRVLDQPSLYHWLHNENHFILGPKRIQLLGSKDHKWGKDLTSSTPGMKITAGHRPKSVHIARLAIHFALRSDITAGRGICVCLQELNYHHA